MKLRKYIYNLLIFGFFLMNGLTSIGQRDLTHKKKNKRSDVFGGAVDVRSLKNYGLQVTVGATYLYTKKANDVVHVPAVRPYDYLIQPSGTLGFYFDIGSAHFPMGESKFKFIKKRFLSYYDWGLGFKLLDGAEKTVITYFDASGNEYSTDKGSGSFNNGYVSLRGTAHKNIYFKQKYFLDNGLGLNLDYRLFGSQDYGGVKAPPVTQSFQKPFIAQFHFEIGLGIKKRRGTYIIPGIQIPILGIVDHVKFDWFSSKYYPILFKVKFINLFEVKKSKTSCNEGSEEDKKNNKEYMQGQ